MPLDNPSVGNAFMDFWSDPVEEVQLAAGGGNVAIAGGNVTVAVPAGVAITRVIAMFVCRAVENTNAAVNAINNAASDIQVRDTAPGVWTDAINITDNMFEVAGSTREMGTVILGSIDVSGEVDANAVYEFQWENGQVDQDFLNFNDVLMGIRVYFRR